LVKLLLNNRVNVNTQGGKYALLAASQGGHLEITQLLLEANVDLSVRGKDEGTALHIAAEYGNSEIAKLLLHAGADIEAINENGQTPLHIAAKEGNSEIVELLLCAGVIMDATDESGQTALHYRNKATMSLLLAHGAAVNVRGGWDKATPLQMAVEGEQESIVQLLLAAKADTNVKDDTGTTALHLAATKGYASIARLLLGAKADVNIRDKWGHTALHYANNSDMHESIVGLLLKAGADVDAEDERGQTPLHNGSESGDYTKTQMLVDTGADVTEHGTVALYLAMSSLDFFENQFRWAPSPRPDVQAVIMEGYLKVLQLLLKAGADINAEINGSTILKHLTGRASVMKDRFRGIFPPDGRIYERKTIIDVSEQAKMMVRYCRVVQMFLEAGANITKEVREVMRIAAEKGYKELVEVLQRHEPRLEDVYMQESEIDRLKGKNLFPINRFDLLTEIPQAKFRITNSR
jgi:ankyrin repeat protein